MVLVCVLRDVEILKQTIFYSYIARFLVLSGILFFAGLVSLWPPHSWHLTILLNSVLPVWELRCGIQFYLSFGLLLCGKFGKKEITELSMVKNAQCRDWWTK